MKFIVLITIIFFASFIRSQNLTIHGKVDISDTNCKTSAYCCACLCPSSSSTDIILEGFVGANDCSQCATVCYVAFPSQCSVSQQSDFCLPTNYHSKMPGFPLALCIIVSLIFFSILGFFSFRIYRKEGRDAHRGFSTKFIEFLVIAIAILVVVASILFWVGTGNQKSMLDEISQAVTGIGGIFDWVFVPLWILPIFTCINAFALLISVFNEVFEYSCFGRCCLVCWIPFSQILYGIPMIVPFILNVATSAMYSTGICSQTNVGGFSQLCMDFSEYSTLAMLGSGILITISGFIFILSCVANCVIQRPHHDEHHHHHHHQKIEIQYGNRPPQFQNNNVPYQTDIPYQNNNNMPYQNVNNDPPKYTNY